MLQLLLLHHPFKHIFNSAGNKHIQLEYGPRSNEIICQVQHMFWNQLDSGLAPPLVSAPFSGAAFVPWLDNLRNEPGYVMTQWVQLILVPCFIKFYWSYCAAYTIHLHIILALGNKSINMDYHMILESILRWTTFVIHYSELLDIWGGSFPYLPLSSPGLVGHQKGISPIWLYPNIIDV